MKPIQAKHLRDFKHPLVTRRDFLTHGVLAFSAVAAIPWAAKAMTLECGGTVGSSWIPFMTFDMAGGGSLPGNFLVGKRGGSEDLLPAYNTLGWDPRESGGLNKEFGLPMSAKYSTMLAGILAKTSPAARLKLKMGSLCHRADFDTSSNQLNSGTLVMRSGSRGLFVTNGLAIEDSLSGGNSAGPGGGPLYKPVFVNSIEDILKSTSIGGPAFQGFGVQKMTALANGAIDLSSIQKADYATKPGGPELGEASKCAYSKSLDFLKGVDGMDPRTDAEAQAVYAISQQTSSSDMNAVTASLALNTITGNSGPCTWTLGGCDYHTGSNKLGDEKDLEVGQQIGMAVELAHRKQRPFFFQLITDGGNTAQGGRNWSSDSAETSMSVVGFYDPKGEAKLLKTQIGAYTNGQGADTTSVIGNDPRLAAYATFANYLSLSGRLGEFHDFAPDVFTKPDQLESVLLFANK